MTEHDAKTLALATVYRSRCAEVQQAWVVRLTYGCSHLGEAYLEAVRLRDSAGTQLLGHIARGD